MTTDNDNDLKNLLVGQAKKTDSPFEIIDLSIKHTISKDWKDSARKRIKGYDVVIVICGKKTDSAAGVSAELRIAQDENVPYFLICGRSDENCVKPIAAKDSDKIHKWTWDNLKSLIGGGDD